METTLSAHHLAFQQFGAPTVRETGCMHGAYVSPHWDCLECGEIIYDQDGLPDGAIHCAAESCDSNEGLRAALHIKCAKELAGKRYCSEHYNEIVDDTMDGVDIVDRLVLGIPPVDSKAA